MSTVLDTMPTLGDALAGAKPALAIKGRSRVHRIVDDPDPEHPTDEQGQPAPVITPFVATAARGEVVTAKESSMPKGVYKRKDREAAEPGAAGEPKAPRKKRAKKINGGGRGATPAAVTFVVDDMGRVSIVPADGERLDLSGADTKRLAAFLDRTKAFRS